MSIFVDTGVWSLALRRDAPPPSPEVRWLEQALQTGEAIFTTGVVLQEFLQGFTGPRARVAIVDRFAALPWSYRIGETTLMPESWETRVDETACRWERPTYSMPSFAFDTNF